MLARGAVTDRPWGQTLGALGTKRLTGQVSVVSEDKTYEIAFELGTIVAASSPLVSDAAVRIALTNHLISKAAVPEITRRIAAAPEREELEVLAEVTGLSPQHVDHLRRKVIAQRAARTLALEVGEFEVHDSITLSIVPGVALDVQAVIYFGARMNISEQHLAEALRSFGDAWRLSAAADAMLDKFGFTEDVERTIVQELRVGSSIPELEAAHHDIDPRTLNAVVYALFACGACVVQDAPIIPRAGTATVTSSAQQAISAVGSAADGMVRHRSPTTSAGLAAARTATREVPPSPYSSFVGRTQTPPSEPPAAVRNTPPRDPSLEEHRPRSTSVTGAPRTISREAMGTGARPAMRDPSVGEQTPRSARDSSPVISRTSTSPGAARREFDDGAATPAAVRASRGQTSAPPVNGARVTTPPPMAAGTLNSASPLATLDLDPPAVSFSSSRTATSTSPPNSGVGGRSTSDEIFGQRPPAPSRTQTPPSGAYPVVGRVPTGQLTTGLQGRITGTSPPARAPTGQLPVTGRVATGQPATGRAPTGEPTVSRTSTARRTKALIAARLILLEQNADYYQLLGVPFDASADIVRTTYLNLSRVLHPDKLTDLGVDDPTGVAGKLFAAISHAFTVLTDPVKRNDYMVALLRGDNPFPSPVQARTKTAEQRGAEAAEAFKRGESALRRDEPTEACIEFAKAVELAPQDVDYQAMLGWAQFCASSDRASAAKTSRLPLEKAIQKSATPVPARFLLGRMERMLGRDREALYHFQQVIELQLNHAEAASEIRAIEARARMKK